MLDTTFLGTHLLTVAHSPKSLAVILALPDSKPKKICRIGSAIRDVNYLKKLRLLNCYP